MGCASSWPAYLVTVGTAATQSITYMDTPVALAWCAGDACSCDLGQRSLVCGTDGITYQSYCLASCQDVAVAREEPCNPADADLFPSIVTASSVPTAAAGVAAMNK